MGKHTPHITAIAGNVFSILLHCEAGEPLFMHIPLITTNAGNVLTIIARNIGIAGEYQTQTVVLRGMCLTSYTLFPIRVQ